RKVSAKKITLICIAGWALNLIGSLFANVFALPFYLDTGGTVFIAALGGYVPGIAVGFFTNLTKSFVTPSEMYFCSISIAIAILTTFFSRRGYFSNFRKAIFLIPALAFLAGTGDFLLEHFLRASDFLTSFNAYEESFINKFPIEFVDKAISVLIAFFMMKFVPAHIRKNFRTLGQKQAPLSEDMREAIDERKNLSSSLRTKTLAILMLSSLLLSFSISLISYLLFRESAVNDRVRFADGLVSVVLNEINPDKVDEYLKLVRDAEGYKETEDRLYTVKNSNRAVEYIYVYRIDKNGCHVIFDLNTSKYEGDKTGEVVPLEESVLPYRDDLIAGKPIPPIISNDEYGFLLTLYKPLYDVNGKCQCYAAIDYSMEALTEYARTFMIKLLALFIGCFIFIFAIGIVFVENNIILPVNTMAYCARHFSYDSSVARERNIERIKQLKICTGDEIENLYQAMIRTTENILKYLEHLQRARTQVSDMLVKVSEMDEIAHKDSLTGVQNKTAYVEATEQLDNKIASGRAEFCIVMVDVNFLKKINDTYGHECGNTYLVNSCKLVCSVFGTEHVYRIGGDEFVVIIEGEKASICKYFVGQFKTEMERKNANSDLQPWEKIS
ncbi:MAG: GGDEF domain-containing protein, partial [Selenomonadaceae bacterium]|nr:GGDEF domain-containing protein [Selenomonadaceae bacterium]